MTKNESTLKGLFIRSEVLHDVRLHPAEKLAAGYIEYRAAATGEYWEKPDTLARVIHVKPRQISNILQDLIRAGYIVKTGQIRNRHIVYQVPRTMQSIAYLGKQTMQSIAGDSMQSIAEDYIYNKQEEENNNNAHLTNAQECDLFGDEVCASEQKPESVFPFADFWSRYPRKVDKKRAEKIYGKLPEATRALIKERLPDFAKEWQGKDAAFIPYPSTWLNGERWNDEPQPQPQAQTADEVFNSIHF